MENGRCRIHGGLSPKGTASARWKHGRYSRYLPKGIADAYKRAEAGPELLSLREDVAVLDALQADALRSMKGDLPPWTEALKHGRKLVRVVRGMKRKPVALDSALAGLMQVL